MHLAAWGWSAPLPLISRPPHDTDPRPQHQQQHATPTRNSANTVRNTPDSQPSEPSVPCQPRQRRFCFVIPSVDTVHATMMQRGENTADGDARFTPQPLSCEAHSLTDPPVRAPIMRPESPGLSRVTHAAFTGARPPTLRHTGIDGWQAEAGR